MAHYQPRQLLCGYRLTVVMRRIWIKLIAFWLTYTVITTTFHGCQADIVKNYPIVEACDASNANNHFIYCSGKLLAAVNHHVLYNDSKTFVDKPLKYDAAIVGARFKEQFPGAIRSINRHELQLFIDENFHSEGEDLERCELREWQREPPELRGIRDKIFRNFAYKLHKIWKLLCRKIKPSVKEHPDRNTLIYVDRPFVIPGGRFREYYYWDAYWIIKGLIASGLHETVQNMILNFVQLVNRYGFVPNGGRNYYLQRSQPPMLILMVYEYYEATRNITFVQEILPTLEKELDFWDEKRRIDVDIDGRTHSVYQYRAGSNVPRPESYRADVALTKDVKDERERRRIYRDIASAAESGWDFSSRWFKNPTDLRTIHTTDIVPVDLNAFICGNFKILRFFYAAIGNDEKSQHYDQRFHEFLRSFNALFYVANETGWYDYDRDRRQNNIAFFPAMASPLFTGCYSEFDTHLATGVYERMEKMGALHYPGGIPTSLTETGQQWDYPNGWSPLNHMIIEGFRKTKNAKLQQKAYKLAEKWLTENYRVYLSNGRMWEKYDVANLERKIASGGEYFAQDGFGWTNGVLLDLLRTYSDRLEFKGTLLASADDVQDE